MHAFCSHGMTAIWLVLYALGSARALFAEIFSLDQSSRLQRHLNRAMAEQNTAKVTDELRRELQLAQHRMLEQRRLSNSDVYVAQQHLWFEQQNKRGPPSTAVSSMATPQEDGQDQITGAASSAQPKGTIPICSNHCHSPQRLRFLSQQPMQEWTSMMVLPFKHGFRPRLQRDNMFFKR